VLDRAMPTVSVHHIAGGAIATVGPDNDQAGYLATRHLLDLGHRVVGSITGVRGRRLSQSRRRGYRRALDEAGVEGTDDPARDAAIGASGTAARRIFRGEPT
jgi:DNA-binding LacI/PurR family transcriptional regulator